MCLSMISEVTYGQIVEVLVLNVCLELQFTIFNSLSTCVQLQVDHPELIIIINWPNTVLIQCTSTLNTAKVQTISKSSMQHVIIHCTS